MGTRSTITFIGKTGNKEIPYVKIYQQYDGYISGIGYELANFLKKRKIINGISNFNLNSNTANGIGCLAAQYIALKKVEIGGLYIDPIDSSDEYIDYCYKVIINEDKVPNFADKITTIEVTNFGEDKIIFKGSPSELLKFRDDEDEEEENE